MLVSLFSCCIRRRPSPALHQIPDETSRLIPQSADTSPPISPNLVVVDQERLKERLGDIIRSKEGKMVNVNAPIPFNLHNQRVPPSRAYHRLGRPTSTSASASASRSVSASTSRNENTYNNYGTTTTRPSELISQNYHHHSTLALESSRSSSRCSSSGLDEEFGDVLEDGTTPGPILNIRLVAGAENGADRSRGSLSRGRSRARGKQREDAAGAGAFRVNSAGNHASAGEDDVDGMKEGEIGVEVQPATDDEQGGDWEATPKLVNAIVKPPHLLPAQPPAPSSPDSPASYDNSSTPTSPIAHHHPQANAFSLIGDAPQSIRPQPMSAVKDFKDFQIKDTGLLVMSWGD